MATLKQEFIFFNDNAGRTLPNAKMKFFEAGTTTPKATYTGVDLASPNQWPVIADGSGIFPPIFLDSGGYKIEVYDENDVLIRTRDNLNIADTTILSTSNFYFSTLVDAKLGVLINGSSINLQEGQVVRTVGQNTETDGEGAEWLVVAEGTGTADDNLFADLQNGLQLQRLLNQLYTKNNLSEIKDAGSADQIELQENITPVEADAIGTVNTYIITQNETPFDVSTIWTDGTHPNATSKTYGKTGSSSNFFYAGFDYVPDDAKAVKILFIGTTQTTTTTTKQIGMSAASGSADPIYYEAYPTNTGELISVNFSEYVAFDNGGIAIKPTSMNAVPVGGLDLRFRVVGYLR